MANLPKNWIEVPFTRPFDIQGGTQPPKSSFIYEEKEGYIRLLQIRDFGKKPVPTYIPIKKTLKTCVENDILIARYGASIGRILTGMAGAYNVAIAKVLIPENIDKRFVFHLLNSSYFQEPILSIERSAQDGFNKDDLSRINIPLPPLNEQKRIVSKLDKVMPKIDGINERLDKIPAILKRFRQSVLTQAVTGELTKDWRESKVLTSQNIEQRLEEEKNKIYLNKCKLAKEKGDKNPQKPKKFKLVDTTIDISIPKSWIFLNLSQIIYDFKYGTSNKSEYSYTGIPVIRIPNINLMELDFDDIKYLQETKIDDANKITKNDILIVRSNGSRELVGKNALVRELKKEYAFASYLIRLRPVIINPEYLLFLLNTDIIKEQFFSKAKSSAGINNINSEELATTIIPFPPLEEQEEIVKRVKDAFKKADKIEERYKKAKTYTDKLTQSVLNKAFSGNLVPQDPNDKPVEIKIEK